jgi:hypothetical protein
LAAAFFADLLLAAVRCATTTPSTQVARIYVAVHPAATTKAPLTPSKIAESTTTGAILGSDSDGDRYSRRRP